MLTHVFSRTGTFLSKAYDEVPTISVTFTAQNCESSFSQNIDSIDPDNYRLLIPSHLTDPNKLKKYPQVRALSLSLHLHIPRIDF